MQLVRINDPTQDYPLGPSLNGYGLFGFVSALPSIKRTTKTDDWLTLPPSRATGLDDVIGTWQDERDVQEIVRDIYDNRTSS